jgi:hypothetical protein
MENSDQNGKPEQAFVNEEPTEDNFVLHGPGIFPNYSKTDMSLKDVRQVWGILRGVNCSLPHMLRKYFCLFWQILI